MKYLITFGIVLLTIGLCTVLETDMIPVILALIVYERLDKVEKEN